MKKLSTLFLGLACVSMLASCGKEVTAQEAKEIANANWTSSKVSEANYASVKILTQSSSGDKDETTFTGIALTALLLSNRTLNLTAVNLASENSGTFKSYGTALEFTYSSDGISHYYKTNEVGLTVYEKTTQSDSSWTSSTYTWSKA